MVFEKKTWVEGEFIEDHDLNRMEQGIEDAASEIGLLSTKVDDNDNANTTAHSNLQTSLDEISAQIGTTDISKIGDGKITGSIDEIYKKLTAYVLNGITINAGDDLNNIHTAGLYKCGTNTTVETLKNCPTQYGFTLICMTTTVSDSSIQSGKWTILLQIIVTITNAVYVRNISYRGTTALVTDPWVKVSTTAV